MNRDAPLFLRSARAILAATALDAPSVVALRRAHELSKSFDARLLVVHCISPYTPPLVEHEDEVRRSVVRWAATDAQVVLGERDVSIAVGDPARAIKRAACAMRADLVVVGPRAEPAKPHGTVASLVSSLSQSLLVAHDRHAKGELVAATDLLDARFPVVRTAAKLAAGLDARVTLVHNLESDGEPIPPGGIVRNRMRELERLTHSVQRIHRAHVSVMPSTAEAIARVAKERDADMAVVGVRRGHGRTLLSLLALASCSVLAIPLDGAF